MPCYTLGNTLVHSLAYALLKHGERLRQSRLMSPSGNYPPLRESRLISVPMPKLEMVDTIRNKKFLKNQKKILAIPVP